MIFEDGKQRVASMEEMLHKEELFRFGVIPRRLLTGSSLRSRALISGAVWRSLVATAKDQGSSPNLWFGSLSDIPVTDTVVQRMTASDIDWQPFDFNQN